MNVTVKNVNKQLTLAQKCKQIANMVKNVNKVQTLLRSYKWYDLWTKIGFLPQCAKYNG